MRRSPTTSSSSSSFSALSPPPPTPANPLHLLRSAAKLSLGCPLLDRLLGGGLPAGTITELAGGAASGKSQICLRLLLSALLPPHLGGLSAASILLLSGDHPVDPLLRRLRRLPFPSHHLPSASSSPLDHVFVSVPRSPQHLLALLARADALLARSPSPFPIRLIIIDSLAALFRDSDEFSPSDLRRRSNALFRVAAKLKKQAARFGCVVVVTNQITDVFADDAAACGGPAARLQCSGRMVAPSLGLAWSNCVNLRLFLSISEEVVRKEVNEFCEAVDMSTRRRRRMQVVFAPHLPEGECEFRICKGGVFGVERDEESSGSR